MDSHIPERKVSALEESLKISLSKWSLFRHVWCCECGACGCFWNVDGLQPAGGPGSG